MFVAIFLLYLFFIIFGVGLPAYLINRNPFLREHIFVGFNEFPFLVRSFYTCSPAGRFKPFIQECAGMPCVQSACGCVLAGVCDGVGLYMCVMVCVCNGVCAMVCA